MKKLSFTLLFSLYLFPLLYNSASVYLLPSLTLSNAFVHAVEENKIKLSLQERDYLNTKKQLKVCIDPKWMPYESIDNRGQYVGMSSDYIDILSQQLDIPISLLPTKSWNETLEKAKNRECDIISMARETEDRKSYLNFSTPYVAYPYVIATTSDKPYLKRLNDNLDKTYAVVKGYAIVDYLKEWHPEINLLEVNDFDDGIEAIRSEDAYGYIDSAATIGFYTNQKGLSDIKASGFTGFSSEVSVASRNDEPILSQLINRVLLGISSNKKQIIEQRWINVIYTPPIEEQSEQVSLSNSEKLFLNKQPTVTMCVDPDWMPYETLINEKHHGIAADVLQLVAQRAGLTLKVIPSRSWKHSLALFKDKQCDILSMINKTEERDVYMNYTKPYYQGHIVFVARNDHPFIADPSEVVGKKIAVAEGYSISGLLQKNFSGIHIVKVNNYNQAFDMVAKGEADLTADYLISSGERIQKRGLYELKIAGNTLYKNKLRIGVQKEQPTLLSILNKYIATLKTHEINTITNKWRTVRYQKETDYTLIWQITGLALLISSITLYWNRRLLIANKNTQKALKALDDSKKEIEILAITDKLTGLYNRTKLDSALDQELKRSLRYERPFSLFILDADHFKKINDEHGHQAGDAVLQHLASVLKSCLRETDITGRWGGEEFLVICPETNTSNALLLADKILVEIEKYRFPIVTHQTVSIGITVSTQEDAIEDILRRADLALYEAKKSGRNQFKLKN